MFLAMNATMCEEIKNIYVLGHSMGPADIDYFDFLMRSTKTVETNDIPHEDERINVNPTEELYNRLQYVVESTGHHKITVGGEHAEAMKRKLMQEQNVRNDKYQKGFLKMFGKVPKQELEKASAKIKPRTEDAKWHISYYSDRDKEWIEIVMRELGCRSYKLYSSIDECLQPFKK
jgi:hypothetical protein